MITVKEGTWTQLSAAILLMDSATQQTAVGAFVFYFNGIAYSYQRQTSDGYFIFADEPKPGAYRLIVYQATAPDKAVLDTSIKIPKSPNASNAVFTYELATTD